MKKVIASIISEEGEKVFIIYNGPFSYLSLVSSSGEEKMDYYPVSEKDAFDTIFYWYSSDPEWQLEFLSEYDD